MTDSGVQFRLAPGIVIRIAGWPEAALRGLATLRSPEELDSEPSAAYRAAYEVAVEHGRCDLWARTAADPRFMRAVAVANPRFAMHVSGRSFSPRRSKRVRHLETTLYRYLARAVARTEPNGLWTGVCVGEWATRTRLCRRASRYAVTPDLDDLRNLVRALEEQHYARTRTYGLNATLERQPDGAYLYWARQNGKLVQRRIDGFARFEGVLEALRDHSESSLVEMQTRVAECTRMSAETMRVLIEQLRSGGVLIPHSIFPARFASPWQALDLVESRLLPDHAAAWQTMTNTLRDCARALEGRLDVATPEEVVALFERANAARDDLARAWNLGLPPRARAPLRCDMRAPWTVELGPAEAARLEMAIAQYSRFQESNGLEQALLSGVTADRMREEQRAGAHELSTVSARFDADAGCVSWENLAARFGNRRELSHRVAQSAAWLDARAEEVLVSPHEDGLGEPLGSLWCTFVGTREKRVLVHGTNVDAGACFARLWHLLSPEQPAQRLQGWLHAAYRRLHEETGIEAAELCFEGKNANVFCRPDTWSRVIDLWRGELRNSRPLRLVRLYGRSAPLVEAEPGPKLLALFAGTTAAVPDQDFFLNLLLSSSGRVPLRVPDGAHLVHEAERALPRHSPRVALPGGTIVRTRRTLLTAGELSELLKERGVRRYHRWQRLAARYGWPELVLVHRNDGLPLLVPRDCPLAVEAAFEGAAESNLCIKIEEFEERSYLGDESDERYGFELVLPFLRSHHTWHCVARGQPELAPNEPSFATAGDIAANG